MDSATNAWQTKTITKKSKNKNNDSDPSPLIENKTNSNKRKLNEYDVDIDNEPDRKKRKFNENNANKLNALFESNSSLKKRNNKLTKDIYHYKQESNKWKSKYMKLYSKLYNVTGIETISLATTIKTDHMDFDESVPEDNSINTKYDNIQARLLEMGFDKNQVINKISSYNGSGQTMQSVFNQVINTFTTSNQSRQLRSNTNRNRNINTHDNNISCDSDSDIEFIKFKDSYYVSVNCHICRKYFNDIFAYKEHLQQHYKTDPNKTWKQCDLSPECNVKYNMNSMRFIGHIATHTKDKPFKCKLIINGLKCSTTMGCLSSIKTHWKSHFQTTKIDSTDSESSTDSEIEENSNSNKNNVKLHHFKIKASNKYVEFEASYHFSINCYICQQHFDAFDEYRDHIKAHYNTDPNKTWTKCEFGCKTVSKGDQSFIGHIATHSNTKPFHCDVLIDGVKCAASLSRKSFLKDHWKRHFPQDLDANYKPEKECKNAALNVVKNKKKIKTKLNSCSQNKCESKQITDITNNINAEYVMFEDSYHVSVHCHMCRMHFDDIYRYENHLQQHYIMDCSKSWRKCDFGCVEDFVSSVDFIAHIASQHTKEKPFKCDVVVNAIKCGATLCRKSHVKRHWESHFQSGNINEKNSIESVDFEDSYYVSVDCHICKKHFSDFVEYKEHIKQHYESDPLRTWLKCDFGCNIDPYRPLFSGFQGFINHIASHTKDYPFKCNLRIDGKKCKNVAGMKSYLKKHFNRQHCIKPLKNKNKNKNSNNDYNESESFNCSESESESCSQSETESDDESVDFEQSYIFCMQCHICDKYFDDFVKYKDHVKKHYINDPNRKWMQCDFGCCKKDGSGVPAVSSHSTNFIAHIAMHTKQKPYKCLLSVNGIKCTRTSTTKGDISNHWKLNHFNQEKT